jgi:hypothetical protein
VTSHAPCSKALKLLEIFMRAVVTTVVSIAEMKRQSHKAAIIVCNLALLILGTADVAITAASPPTVVFSLSDMEVVRFCKVVLLFPALIRHGRYWCKLARAAHSHSNDGGFGSDETMWKKDARAPRHSKGPNSSSWDATASG